MRLHLSFELDLIGLAQPKGEMVMDIDFYAADGRIEADIKEISFCSNNLLDALGKMFGKTILADEIAKVINDTIMELPARDPRIRKIEILNGPAVSEDATVEAECSA
jgi:hypothetical protein